MAKLVSKTYGEALFELAVEEGKEEEFLQEIESLKEILDANPDFGKLMNHPKILKEEKLKVVEEVFKGHISKELLGFLHIVVAKDRYPEIDAILDYFIDEVKKHVVLTRPRRRKSKNDCWQPPILRRWKCIIRWKMT